MAVKKYLKSPWIETLLMAAMALASYAAIAVISFASAPPAEGMSGVNIFGLVFGFSVLSFVMAFFAAISGVGGGVLFTPVMLAFTSIDSLIIRATGLLFAMFTGLTSTGPVMRKGLGNLKMGILLSAGYGLGSFAGAQGAIFIWKYLGEGGEAGVRIALGLIVAGVASYMFRGGKKLDWPEAKESDAFSERLNLSQPYFENSLGKIVNYKIRRAGPGIALIACVGLISGFFGLGAAWAVVLVQNVVMSAPLKVAAANSLAVVGMGNCVAIWPYLLTGAVIPLFAAPWLVGVVIGGRLGSVLLVNIRAGCIRFFIIGILFFTSFGLIARGLAMLGVFYVPGWVNILIFILVFVTVIRLAAREGRVCD